jgi:hypothetical protein
LLSVPVELELNLPVVQLLVVTVEQRLHLDLYQHLVDQVAVDGL